MKRHLLRTNKNSNRFCYKENNYPPLLTTKVPTLANAQLWKRKLSAGRMSDKGANYFKGGRRKKSLLKVSNNVSRNTCIRPHFFERLLALVAATQLRKAQVYAYKLIVVEILLFL